MNIYVANISFRASEDDLKGLFQQFGEVVSAKIVTDRNTGRSRGFGFVDMPNKEEAMDAIENSVEYSEILFSINWLNANAINNINKIQRRFFLSKSITMSTGPSMVMLNTCGSGAGELNHRLRLRGKRNLRATLLAQAGRLCALHPPRRARHQSLPRQQRRAGPTAENILRDIHSTRAKAG